MQSINNNTKEEKTLIIGCNALQLSSPKKTLDITKVDDCTYELKLAGTGGSVLPKVIVQDGATTTATGDGSVANPITTEVKVANLPNNGVQATSAGLFAAGTNVIGANSGLTFSGNTARVGTPTNATTPGIVLSDREVPLNGYNLVFTGGTRVSIGQTANASLDVTGSVRFDKLKGEGVRIVAVDTNGDLFATPYPQPYSPVEHVFYVSKKYTGAGAAIVTGTTLASITSTNTSYMTQLAAAKMGSLQDPYPDPWSARNAAMDAQIAGIVKIGYIVVLPDNTYTVGSNAATSNGTIVPPYSPSGNEVADVGFSSTNGYSAVASLFQNNIYTEFKDSSGLYYICKAYNIFLGFISDAADNKFVSGILGRGFFHRLYGVAQGFDDLILAMNNTNSVIEFNAKEISFNSRKVFVLNNCGEFHATIDYVYSGDTVFLETYNYRPTTLFAKMSNITFKIKDMTIGYQQSLYPDLESTTAYTKFISGVNLYPKTVNIEIENFTTYLDGNDFALMNMDYATYPAGYSGNTDQRHIMNLTFNFKVNNYKEFPRATVGTPNMGPSIRFMLASRDMTVGGGATYMDLSSNNKIEIELRHASLVAPLTGGFGIRTEGTNNLIVFRSDKMIKDNIDSLKPMLAMNYLQGGPNSRTNVLIDGWFEDKQNHLIGEHSGSSASYGTARVTLRGKFVARAVGAAVISSIPNTSNKFNYILDGVILINDGSTLIITAAAAGTEVLCLGGIANSQVDLTRIKVLGNGIGYDTFVADY